MLVRVLTELLLDIATHFSRITYMPNLTLTLCYWVVNSYEKIVLVHYVSSIRTPSFYVLKVCPLVTPHPLEALRYYEEGSLGPLHRRFDKMGLVALVLLNNTISSLAALLVMAAGSVAEGCVAMTSTPVMSTPVREFRARLGCVQCGVGQCAVNDG